MCSLEKIKKKVESFFLAKVHPSNPSLWHLKTFLGWMGWRKEEGRKKESEDENSWKLKRTAFEKKNAAKKIWCRSRKGQLSRLYSTFIHANSAPVINSCTLFLNFKSCTKIRLNECRYGTLHIHPLTMSTYCIVQICSTSSKGIITHFSHDKALENELEFP